jgi:uncharacterized protein (DUF924 family)
VSTDWRRDVLTFWFGLEPEQWWKADPLVDDQVREQFFQLWEQKRQLPADCFLADPLEALAGVILFDQFPRNMFRGAADQFSTDHLGLAIARAAVDRGLDEQLEQHERAFLYMPFEHSEALADQKRSVGLFTRLGDDFLVGYARKHHDIVERFGRFPHRNAILGRKMRPDEAAAGYVVPW